MKITIKIKPNSRQEKVEQTGENEFTVRVNAPPIEGRANEAMIELLSKHFGVPKRNVTILKGHTSKSKLVEVILNNQTNKAVQPRPLGKLGVQAQPKPR